MKMKIAVEGKNKIKTQILKENLKLFGYKVVEKNPDIVISYGGDGSFLYSERKYPGVPKLITRNDSICKKCVEGDHVELLDKIKTGKYKVKKYKKLETIIIKGKKKTKLKSLAVNDVVIRNIEQFHAIRFNLFIGNKKINEEYVGDGIVVATTFGSTGYYYAITKKSIFSGMGVALNNTMTQKNNHLAGSKTVKFVLNRNSAGLTIDNEPVMLTLTPGDCVEIKQSNKFFRLIQMKK